VDQVGSSVTQANGTVCFDQDYYPYGQEVYSSPGSCPQSYKFTGYERDAETGLDYAFARYYSARLARFMSADPLAGDVGDPQSLNRYAYVRNNPINFIDPIGLDRCPIESRDGPIYGCGEPFPDPVFTSGRDRCYNGCPLPKTFRQNQRPRIPTRRVSINGAVLADCIEDTFQDVNRNIEVESVSVTTSVPGGFGEITVGIQGLSGSITVRNDARTYTSAQLNEIYARSGRRLQSGGTIVGLTFQGSPYTNYTNNNNVLGTARSQVHEFGHSLYEILTAVGDDDGPTGHGSPLDDCVNARGGYVQQ
jgi:RHS repeat-associated protein